MRNMLVASRRGHTRLRGEGSSEGWPAEMGGRKGKKGGTRGEEGGRKGERKNVEWGERGDQGGRSSMKKEKGVEEGSGREQ